jgi:CheY-like chemotaxis protein
MNFSGYGGCITETDTVRHPVLSVLYVDDEPYFLNVCKWYLEKRPDISVSLASSVKNALEVIDTFHFDVIISDYQMSGTDGIGFLRILKEKHCSIPFILFTCRERDESVDEALNNGAMFCLQKGGDPHSRFTELDGMIREACQWQMPDGVRRGPDCIMPPLSEPACTTTPGFNEDPFVRLPDTEFLSVGHHE